MTHLKPVNPVTGLLARLGRQCVVYLGALLSLGEVAFRGGTITRQTSCYFALRRLPNLFPNTGLHGGATIDTIFAWQQP